MRPRSLSILVVDENKFSRGLISEILRNLDVNNISSASTAEAAKRILGERLIDVVLVSWEATEELAALDFVRQVRRCTDDRLRRLPVVFVTSGLTREFVISARDAGVDEFLSKPISPAAVKQRLEMVIETPRPFVDCAVYLGPCRRRKNPADYYGEKRRAGECLEDPSTARIDEDEAAAESPIRRALGELRVACRIGDENGRDSPVVIFKTLSDCMAIATENNDPVLVSALTAFHAYIQTAAPHRRMDAPVVNVALTALEQLATLPLSYFEARNSVAVALGKAIHKKLAA